MERLAEIRRAAWWIALAALLLFSITRGTIHLIVGAAFFLVASVWLLLLLIAAPKWLYETATGLVQYFSPLARAEREAEKSMIEVRLSLQRYLDADAQSASDPNSKADFTLLLRPFKTDGHVTPMLAWLSEDKYVRIKRPGAVFTFHGMLTRWMSLEEAIKGCTAEIAPLVAIEPPSRLRRWLRSPWNRSGHFSLAGVDWQPRILDMMDRAKVIIVSPGTNNGIQWEIGQVALSASLLSKTFFVVPATSDVEGYANWKRIAERTANASGLVLPASEDVSQLVIRSAVKHASEGVAWDRFYPFDDLRLAELRHFIRRLSSLSGLSDLQVPEVSIETRVAAHSHNIYEDYLPAPEEVKAPASDT